MRRVARTDSPEVVRVSEDSPESSFRELDDAFLQTQTRIWLGEVLHIRFDEDIPVADLLADGDLLFRVSKFVWKMLLKKHGELKNSKLFISERTSFSKSDGRYMPYSKVDSFFKICQILGLTGIDLFSPSDVVEKRDVRRVCMCIRSLSKKAMSKQLSVPDFDIVTYTIAMPTDFVGGICKSLEQSRSSSTSSGSCSTDFRNLNGQESYTGHDERSHDYSSESDEAESKFNETELENPSPNSSFHTANKFNLKSEDFSQGSISNGNGLEDQTHGENGHRCRQHEKNILLESIGSTCSSITDTDNNHDQWNSDNGCCHKCFVSHFKSPSITVARIGGRGSQPCNCYVPKTCLTETLISDSLSGCAVENSGIEKVRSTNAEPDDVACGCRIQYEHSDGNPACVLQSLGGICRCEGMKWLQNEKNEDLHHLVGDNFDGKGGSNMDAYSRTSAASSVSVKGYASPDYSIKDEYFYSDYSSHSYDMVLLDSDSPEILLTVPIINKDSDGQAIDEGFCLHKLNLSLERTAALPSNGRRHQGKPTAGNFSFPTINTYEDVAKLGLISDISLDEQFTDENLEENIESPRNCSIYFEFDDIASSTLKTGDMIIPSQYAITSHTAHSDSDGQGFTDVLDRYYSNDDNTCPKPTCGEFEAEQQLILNTAIMEKTNLFNCVVVSDANQQFYDAEAFRDGDATLDCVFSLNTKANGMIGDCHIHESYSNMISAWSELKSGNLVIQNQSEMLSEDGPENCLNHDSFEANRGFMVQDGKNLLEIMSHKEQSNNCHASGSFNEITSDLIEVDTYNLHPMSLPKEDYSSTSTCYGESSKQTLPVEERKKETAVCEKNALTKVASSGKSKDGNTGNIVFKSIAGSCTMIGALLVFLYLRRKSKKNSHTAVSLLAKSSQEDHTQKTVEIDSSYKKYPGERLML